MYKNNLTCRACGHLEESQDHILNQCHKIHTTDQSKIKPEDYFEDDPEILKKTAYKIETVMTLLESYNTSPAPPTFGEDVTATVIGCFGYTQNFWHFHIWGGFAALPFLDGTGTLKTSGILTYREDVK